MRLRFPKVALIEKENREAFLSYWFRRIFLDDWLTKILALGITFGLWLGVSGLRTPVTQRYDNVSLTILVSKNLKNTNTFTPDISLELTGDKRKIDQVVKDNLAVTLDLTDSTEGERTVHLTPESIAVQLPTGVAITKIAPEKISVKLEALEEAIVPVTVETEGKPAEGFEIYSTVVIPAKVKVRGPKSHLATLDYIATEKLNLSKQTAGFLRQQVALVTSDPQLEFVDTATVSVNIHIGKKRVERIVSIDYQTENRKGVANIVLTGPEDLLRELSTDDIRVVESESDSGQSTLGVQLPEKLRNEIQIKNVHYVE
ncbi:MAG: CdaR family protein [Pyrinomonadaceae bacterium]